MSTYVATLSNGFGRAALNLQTAEWTILILDSFSDALASLDLKLSVARWVILSASASALIERF